MKNPPHILKLSMHSERHSPKVDGSANGIGTGLPTKRSKLGALREWFKSPAVKKYEQNVAKEQKDWGTGNKFGGGPYRPLAMTPGAADYYTSKGATGK